MSNKKYVVQIVRSEDNEVVKEIVCGNSERFAEKTENGANINLNHDAYYTRIIERLIDKPV